jgi:hypothetical protein
MEFMENRLMATQYYNECKNDRWIVECVFPGKQNGYFLEAGAANGIWGSSCYVLEKELNWTGICVEPNENFYQQLVTNRPNSICEQICLHYQTGEVTYIEGGDDSISPYLGGIKVSLERMASNPQAGQSVIDRTKEVLTKGKSVTRNSMTLEELLDKQNAPPVIDYAAFDIEGSELNVLSVFPLEKYRFLALSLELGTVAHQLVKELLTPHGYREVQNPFNQNMPWERYYLHQTIYSQFKS